MYEMLEFELATWFEVEHVIDNPNVLPFDWEETWAVLDI